MSLLQHNIKEVASFKPRLLSAVEGPGQEQKKRVYYERAIQTLEQQLQEFQRQLHVGASGQLKGVHDSAELESSTDLIVAEYVHRAQCVLASSLIAA
jgi:hypothetical protein